MPGHRGPSDPQRRDRIITASEAIVSRSGIAGLTHRAAAAEAGVPLGSTTYYFNTLDDLRAATLERFVERYTDWLHDWSARIGHPTPADLVTALTDMILENLETDRDNIIVEYELTTAAMRNPRMLDLATRFWQVTGEVLADKTTPEKARALATVLDGFYYQGITAPKRLDRADVARLLGMILTPDSPEPQP
ncbi:TetR family transcriptional regulator [Nocardia sp. JMUB6875]|uniref:TetR/AcrR family transcriptional regulator n=1 Tax=Nocardia sp. JMUB6875 TaxID=3158170 RepID=UPI0032E6DFE8